MQHLKNKMKKLVEDSEEFELAAFEIISEVASAKIFGGVFACDHLVDCGTFTGSSCEILATCSVVHVDGT
jgi:hypothetical protein